MKTVTDPRHKKREKIIKKLYKFSFGNKKQPEKIIQPIVANFKKIDQIIRQCAPDWPISKLNKIDLAVLRLAIYELMVEKKNPTKVIIDEAIELGKQYGSQSSPKFINGVLGTALDKISKNKCS